MFFLAGKNTDIKVQLEGFSLEKPAYKKMEDQHTIVKQKAVEAWVNAYGDELYLWAKPNWST